MFVTGARPALSEGHGSLARVRSSASAIAIDSGLHAWTWMMAAAGLVKVYGVCVYVEEYDIR